MGGYILSQRQRIKGGQVIDPMVSSYDFFPTIMDYLGVEAPPDPKRVGRSYAVFVRGRKPQWHNELYFEYVRAVRTENLKYIERAREWPSELYDLEADPGERHNVIADAGHKKELAALQSRLHGYYESVGAPPLDQ
jgi:arylsulfatase A-like enzyme